MDNDVEKAYKWHVKNNKVRRIKEVLDQIEETLNELEKSPYPDDNSDGDEVVHGGLTSEQDPSMELIEELR